ncbi:MAG: hypothetical protein ABIZ72_01095 [Candidatus Limnocylindrales bacterium]
MRKRSAPASSRLVRLAAVFVVALVSACGTAAAPDAYDRLTTTTKVAWDPIQVNVGLTIRAGGETIEVDPSAIAVVFDGAATKTGLHVALPADDLRLDPGELDRLGFAGDSVDVDVVYDGRKLYARSALLGSTLRTILGPSGKVPPGDLAGWLGFGSEGEFAALSNLLGMNPTGRSSDPAASAPPATAAALKQTLEAAGITLTSAGVQPHDGSAAFHVAIAIDSDQLVASPFFDARTRTQLGQLGVSVQAFTFSGDVWLDPGGSRIVEIDLHVVSIAHPSEGGDIRITFRDPDGSVSLAPPPSFVDVPLGALITEMTRLIGTGAES